MFKLWNSVYYLFNKGTNINYWMEIPFFVFAHNGNSEQQRGKVEGLQVPPLLEIYTFTLQSRLSLSNKSNIKNN